MKIVCLKWGTMYGADYVNKLYGGVQRNTTLPYEFYCYTDDPTGIRPEVTIFPLSTVGLLGWWNKLYLFHPNNGLSGNVLYFDLDTLIVDNIDEILQYKGNFATLSEYALRPGFKKETQRELASGMMAWTHETVAYLWYEFTRDTQSMTHFNGDQDFITRYANETDLLQSLYPGKIQSYKFQCYDNGLPEKSSVVCFHGNPRPHEATTQTIHSYPAKKAFHPRQWVIDHWVE